MNEAQYTDTDRFDFLLCWPHTFGIGGGPAEYQILQLGGSTYRGSTERDVTDQAMRDKGVAPKARATPTDEEITVLYHKHSVEHFHGVDLRYLDFARELLALASAPPAAEPVGWLRKRGVRMSLGLDAGAVSRFAEGKHPLYATPQPAALASAPVAETEIPVSAPPEAEPVPFKEMVNAYLRDHPGPYDAQPATQAGAGEPVDDWGNAIVYSTNAIDEVTHALTGDEGEDDSVSVLNSLAAYVQNVWPGKTALAVLIEYEEAKLAAQPTEQPSQDANPPR